MSYFVDPYKKYYDALNGKTSITSESSNLTSSVSEAASSVSNLKSSLTSSSWKEMGIEQLATTVIPTLSKNIQILQQNFESGLKEAVDQAINKLLPETKKLKDESDNYDRIEHELNNLVVPPSDSSYYKSYLSKKSGLESELSESKKKCEEYKKNCDTIASAIKALNSSVKELEKAAVSSTQTSSDPQITIVDGSKTGKLYKVNYNGTEFYVANTKLNLFNYQNYILKNGIYQNAGFLGGQCNLLSQNYAVDLMRGTYTRKNVFGTSASSPATRINKQVRSQNPDDILLYMYNEINNGRPIALQVTQKKSYQGLRHFVTVVGFDSSVKSYKDLTPDKILVMDCVDGKVQRLSDRNRKLFNQGGKGYYALGATDTFLAKEVYKGSLTANA